VATSANSFSLGQWVYVEFKATIDPTAGYMEGRLNGAVWVTFTGNTRSTANSFSNQVAVSGGATTITVADFYVLNTDGVRYNDFLGDCKVETRVSTGAGSHTDFTPSAGANWQNVDDIPCNGDTDYNSSSTPGQIDSFTHASLTTAAGTIFAVQECVTARKDDAGSRVLRNYLLSGATAQEGADVGLGTSYGMSLLIAELDPATSAPWLIAAVNALEFGYKEQA
jgi:hypothetical protein